MKPLYIALAALTIALSGNTLAEVKNSTAQGFIIHHHFETTQSIERVYQAISTEISQWWHPDHTYSGAATNLSLDARAGGCFCEIWDGSEVQHLQVVMARPPKMLRLTGGLGPLQGEAVAAVMDWALETRTENNAQVTQVNLHYRVNGYRPDGMASWSQPVDQVLGEQFKRLQQHLNNMLEPQPVNRTPAAQK